MEQGTRVLAVRDTEIVDDERIKIINIYGEGIYLGREKGSPVFPTIPNPKIKLDSGEIIWGCQCWWGAVEKMKENFEGFEFRNVDLPSPEQKDK